MFVDHELVIFDNVTVTEMLMRCYTRRFATTILAQQSVATLSRVTTLQRCVALEIVVANRPV